MKNLQHLLFNVDDKGVATITLNRPEKYNAFNDQTVAEWYECLMHCHHNADIKVIVLTGAGKAFCAGGDIDHMLHSSDNDNALERKNFLWRGVHQVAKTVEVLDKPYICAINGTARGAGMDMTLMCDIRIMAESATMAESYINVALMPGDGGAYYLPRIVGMSKALELFWTGRVIDSSEALDIGIATKIVPEEKLMEEVYKLAHEIAAKPPAPIRFTKRAAYRGMGQDLHTALDLASSNMSVLEDLPEHRAALDQFKKRKK